ncbi:MAG: SDR family oxidoreductase [Terriglobales bacterium]
MDLSLQGKVILVTGGAKGIGAAIVHACGKEGGIPVIFDRDEISIRSLQKKLSGSGITSDAVQVELTDHSVLVPAIQSIEQKFGRIDGLVNNAGLNDGVGLEHGSPEQFATSLQRNLVHYYTMAQAALPFLKQSQGCVVNIASKVAVTGQGGTSGYAASKGAILELTNDWADELSQFGIRVNAVVPAEVITPQYQTWVAQFGAPEEKLRTIASTIPLGRRMTEPDEIASMVVFLLSKKSGGVNGQNLFVDGGYVHLDRRLT